MGKLTAGVVLGLGAAALMTREWQGEAAMIQAVDRAPLDPAVDVGNTYGNGLVLGSAAVGLLAVGTVGNDPAAASLGRELAASLAIAWTATWGVKLAVQSRRPNGGAYSFPSGHTATAFAAAPVFASRYGTPGAVAAYSLAGLTALARIEDEKHYAADVLAGAALGILAGRLGVRLAGDAVSVTPMPAGAGLSVRF